MTKEEVGQITESLQSIVPGCYLALETNFGRLGIVILDRDGHPEGPVCAPMAGSRVEPFKVTNVAETRVAAHAAAKELRDSI